MIKLVHCLRRHPDLAPADFRRYWEEYKPAWQALAGLAGAQRVSFTTTLAIDANDRMPLERGTEEAYDGMVETWAIDARDLDERLADPAAQHARAEVVRLQHEFLDLPRCCFFFAVDD